MNPPRSADENSAVTAGFAIPRSPRSGFERKSHQIILPFAGPGITLTAGSWAAQTPFATGAVSTRYKAEALAGDHETRDDFYTDLINTLREEPFAGSREHPAERCLDAKLKAGGRRVGEWLLSFVQKYGDLRPGLVEILLECLGRQERRLVLRFSSDLAREALRSSSLDVRAAAAALIEALDDKRAATVLQQHLPRETNPWLAERIQSVLTDLVEE